MLALHKHKPIKYLELIEYENYLKSILQLVDVGYINSKYIDNEHYILFEYIPISMKNTLECFLNHRESFVYW